MIYLLGSDPCPVVCVWAIRRQMVVSWEHVPLRGTSVLFYPDLHDPAAWGTDPVTGTDAYTGRVIERQLDGDQRVEREEFYRRTMIVPVRPTTVVRRERRTRAWGALHTLYQAMTLMILGAILGHAYSRV
jgi:hypothetical protein